MCWGGVKGGGVGLWGECLSMHACMCVYKSISQNYKILQWVFLFDRFGKFYILSIQQNNENKQDMGEIIMMKEFIKFTGS